MILECGPMVSSGEDAETVEFEMTSFKDPSGNELSTSDYTALMKVDIR